MDEDDIYGSILSEPKSFSSHLSTVSNNGNSNFTSSNSHSEAISNEQNSNNSIPTPWLFVSNLTWWTNEDDLRHNLGEALSSRVHSVFFLEHKPNGKSRGMAIIEFGDVETAEMAVQLMEGKEIHGKKCEVGFSRNPPIKSFEKNSRMNNYKSPYPNQYQQQQPQNQYNRNRSIDYEIDYNGGHQEYSRQVHKSEESSNTSVQRSSSASVRRDHREGRDNYRDSRDSYHREIRTRSKSPDRRSSRRH